VPGPGEEGENTRELQDPAHLPLRVDHRVAASPTDSGVAAGHQCADAGAVQERHPGHVDDHVDAAGTCRVLNGRSQRGDSADIDLTDWGQCDDPAVALVSGEREPHDGLPRYAVA
jgi:hypothetical protein